MRRRLRLGLAVFFGLMGSAVAQEAPEDPDGIDVRRGFEERRFEGEFDSGNATQLPYRLFVPPRRDEEGPLPIVLVLHGEPLRGEDNRRTLRGLPLRLQSATRERPSILIVPQCSSGRHWTGSGEFESFVPVLEALLMAVESELTERNRVVDVDCRLLCGQGIGADAALMLASRSELRFAAVLASGAGRSDEAFPEPPPTCPTWIWHGTFDPLVPVGRARAYARSARIDGFPLVFTESTAGGHVVWPDTFTGDLALGWLLRASQAAPQDSTWFVESTGAAIGWRDSRVAGGSSSMFSFDPGSAALITKRAQPRFQTPVDLSSSLDGSRVAIAYHEGGLAIVHLAAKELIGYVEDRPRNDGCALLRWDVVLATNSEQGRITAHPVGLVRGAENLASVDFAGAGPITLAGDGEHFFCAGDEGVACFRLGDDSLERVSLRSWPTELPSVAGTQTRLVRANKRLFVLYQGRLLHGEATTGTQPWQELEGPEWESEIDRIEDLSVDLLQNLVVRSGREFRATSEPGAAWVVRSPVLEIATPDGESTPSLRRYWR